MPLSMPPLLLRTGGVEECGDDHPPSLYDLCPSPPEKWRSVVVVALIPLLEGRREGGCGRCPSLFLGSGGVFASPWMGTGQV